ncbi:MAG: aromatic ring-hydroxylating dioxygenase subunit alpha [Kiloniellales bacterium]|nr:aromatic ring-hydroxylating dioxygenase subunit alpha [Kiloniellales bacterium]
MNANSLSDNFFQRLARVSGPIEQATGLPNEAYTSLAYGELERDRLFAPSWMAIGVGASLPKPGDARPVEILGQPLMMLRDRNGEIQVFHNVCSHRGVELITKSCNVGSAITCPYHSWTYSLDGSLRATPMIGGTGKHTCPGFDKKRHGLKPVRSAVWADIIFVNLSGAGPRFGDFIAPLEERWADFDLSMLRHGGADSRIQFDLNCNWKLAVENYCESYHLPWVHPVLNSYSKLEDHYHIELEDHFSGQGSLAYIPSLSDDGRRLPAFEGLAEKWYKGGEWVALYPNVLLGIHADHFFVIVLEPVSMERTREHIELYYLPEAAETDEYGDLRRNNIEAWREVFSEDVGVVEAMQRGRASPAFTGGAFSPVMDGPTYCFHKWAARRLCNPAHGLAQAVGD